MKQFNFEENLDVCKEVFKTAAAKTFMEFTNFKSEAYCYTHDDWMIEFGSVASEEFEAVGMEVSEEEAAAEFERFCNEGWDF